MSAKFQDHVQYIDVESFDFLSFYKNLKNKKKKKYAIRCADPAKIFKKIKSELVVIKAAGGLAINEEGEYLFIYRNKKWDLPKGKVEKGEVVKEAAVREVEEECGVTVALRDYRICKTYHIYEMNGHVVLKRTNWYKMLVKGKPKLVPQIEEGITDAVWLAPSKIEQKTENMYSAIRDVLKKEKLI